MHTLAALAIGAVFLSLVFARYMLWAWCRYDVLALLWKASKGQPGDRGLSPLELIQKSSWWLTLWSVYPAIHNLEKRNLIIRVNIESTVPAPVKYFITTDGVTVFESFADNI